LSTIVPFYLLEFAGLLTAMLAQNVFELQLEFMLLLVVHELLLSPTTEDSFGQGGVLFSVPLVELVAHIPGLCHKLFAALRHQIFLDFL
jgi:hypothetical protein